MDEESEKTMACHQIKHKLNSNYAIIQNKLITKFHRAKKIESLNLSEVSNESIEGLGLSKDKLTFKFEQKSIFIKEYILSFFIQYGRYFYSSDIDWTRGRIDGRVESIIIENGVIMEKIYRTRKGSLIIVKRAELGFLTRLSG